MKNSVFALVGLLFCFILYGFSPPFPQSLGKLIAEKLQKLHLIDSDAKVYMIEFIGVGDCVKCTSTSTTIKNILLKDSIIAKRCTYVGAPITERRKDADAIMENNTIFDSFAPLKIQELSDNGIEIKDKFILLDKNFKIRYKVSSDKYLSNNFIKDMILECRKIAKE